MRISTLVAAIVCAFTVSASAQVIVFKGAGRFQPGNDAEAKIAPYAVSIVFDTTTQSLTGTTVLANKKEKEVFSEQTRVYGYSEIGTKPKRSVVLTAAGSNFTNTELFNNGYVFLRGPVKQLQLTQSGGSDFRFATPIGGFISDTGAGAQGGFTFLGNLFVKYDAERTQAANAAGKNAAQVVTDIIADFLTKGFQLPN